MNSTNGSNEILTAQRAALSRRHFLRGLGACLALPAFESLRPLSALAGNSAGVPATSPTGAPIRTAVVYFPNGAIPANWWPEGENKEFKLNRTMQPLEPLKHRLQIISGLD